ncbi:MAG TPA: type II secretion system protein N [Sphingorhabdus sp.]|nr:type II secretion system protein N [Sphingorhabdus sp.]
MNNRRLIIASVLMLVAAAIIFMPLRAVVGFGGVSARKVDGIIWDGSIRDLRIGRLAVGDVNARLLFVPLLIGRAEIMLSRGDAPYAPGLSGKIARRWNSVSVEGLKATLPVGALFAPLPAENIELQDFSARFTSGRCVAAGGNARLTLGRAFPGGDLSNGLLAKPRCDRGQLLVPFVSQSAMERISFRISADGRYEANIFLEGDRTDAAAPLALAGFRAVSGGYRMTRKGRL